MSNPKLPAMLSLQRALNLTDGRMYSIIKKPGDQDGENLIPVTVVRHGIRGVLGSATAHETRGKSVSNPQVTETAKLHPQAYGLSVRFTILPMPMSQSLFACNDKVYAAKLKAVVNALEDSASLMEVSRRYIHNILSGRWLWRNLVLGKPQIEVKFGPHSLVVKGWKADGFPRSVPAEYQSGFDALAKHLCEALSGHAHATAPIEVEARIEAGSEGAMGLMEVYPSQNMLSTEKKPKGFARPLYKVNPLKPSEMFKLLKPEDNTMGLNDVIVMGEAALRDQKVGNAIRTIDTWYIEGRENDVDPIPVEPNGASLRDNDFYRIATGKSGYSLLASIDDLLQEAEAKKQAGAESADLMYIAGLIVRGGVFSGESEKPQADETKPAKPARGKKGKTTETEPSGDAEAGAAASDPQVTE